MVDSGGDKHQAARFHRPLLVGDVNHASAADHEINLVFAVRPLAVGGPLWPYSESCAQLVGHEKVNVAVAVRISGLGIEFGNLMGFHG